MAGDLNITMTRAELFEFPTVARLRLAPWRGVAAGVRHSSRIYGPLLFVLVFVLSTSQIKTKCWATNEKAPKFKNDSATRGSYFFPKKNLS